mmetsp:Transcript_7470/g.13440  ORF Transcript_7470/g.13440 Transcript_7470/m.13440 type:complete len:664 (+) Transcript_7470:75-2066(+)
MGNYVTLQCLDISGIAQWLGGAGTGLPPHEVSADPASSKETNKSLEPGIIGMPKMFAGAVTPKGCLLAQTDVGVAQLVDSNKGLQLPWAIILWHWGMVIVAGIVFTGIFFATTPLTQTVEATGLLVEKFGLPAAFPWQTFAQKLMIFWYLWEALGLGVIHGPMHAKFKPPFQDWWYRFTPGTLKYPAPFLPKISFFEKRNFLDVLVETVITYGLIFYLLTKPSISHTDIWPLFACSVYEFLFDYGQHLHTYATQTMHVFACMCFPLDQGQVVGIQVFLTFFYACSGYCKIGPCFKFLNVANLMTAKYMTGAPWSKLYRKLMFVNAEPEKEVDADYNLTCSASIFSFLCAILETLGPALCLVSGNDSCVLAGLFFFLCMHLYIISTLIVDVFTWNCVDAVYYVVIFGILNTGFEWAALATMSPYLKTWLGAHALYAIYGNFVPSHVPYIVAHRHAAGNFSQGMLFIKFEALGKFFGFAAQSAHPGLPGALDATNEIGMKWFGQWLAVHALVAYFWLWNMPSRMLVPVMQSFLNSQGKKYNEYVMIHSVLLFDALCAHVRFDGLSGLQMVEVLGKRCSFEPGDCTLCWVGAFQAFPIQGLTDATAKWKIVDSSSGVLKEGLFSISDCENKAYKKPSDCGSLVDKVTKTAATEAGKGLLQPLLGAA